MNKKPVVVIGDGWSALGTVGFLVTSGVEVRWIQGAGPRSWAPLSCLGYGPGVSCVMNLVKLLGLECAEWRTGSFIREYRNKSFREPAWVKAPSPSIRRDVQGELLWAPEQKLVGVFDSCFKVPFTEIEEAIRQKLEGGGFPHLQRFQAVPVTGVQVDQGCIRSVVLGSGLEIDCEKMIYADRWGLLYGIEGLPKPLSFMRNLDPFGALQVTFTHSTAMMPGVLESFLIALPRESGEKIERHIWGYFSGHRSTWTLCLTQEEVENNHEIAKKFRRLKSSLDRAFSASGAFAERQMAFLSTLSQEQVRLSEEFVFSSGKVNLQGETCERVSGILFLTDAYGPSRAFEQVGAVLGIETENFDSQSEDLEWVSPHVS